MRGVGVCSACLRKSITRGSNCIDGQLTDTARAGNNADSPRACVGGTDCAVSHRAILYRLVSKCIAACMADDRTARAICCDGTANDLAVFDGNIRFHGTRARAISYIG